MSNDKFTELSTTAATAALDALGPFSAIGKLIGAALGKPDLDAMSRQVLHADVVRLFNGIQKVFARLDEVAKSKVDAVEAHELAMQTVANMSRTASSEKRRLMANVLLNGLAGEDGDEPGESRVFVRAVADLDPEHIEVLAIGEEHEAGVIDEPDGHRRALVLELAARGLIKQITHSGYDDVSGYTYEISDLGERFLAYVSEPE